MDDYGKDYPDELDPEAIRTALTTKELREKLDDLQEEYVTVTLWCDKQTKVLVELLKILERRVDRAVIEEVQKELEALSEDCWNTVEWWREIGTDGWDWDSRGQYGEIPT